MIYGESTVDRELRIRLRDAALWEYENIRVGLGTPRNLGNTSPIASNIGLGKGK